MQHSRVIIVSNRLPITLKQDPKSGQYHHQTSSGGLVTGLSAFFRSHQTIWVGHSGIFSGDKDSKELINSLEAQNFFAVKLTKKQYAGYYNGMSNDVIWPLFHYFPSAVKLNSHDWQYYKDVNQIFADKILSIAQPGDYIWVHDYQLMLLPKLLRDSNKQLNIAYFHHIPFPSSEVFRLLPFRDEILAGLMGSDLIGFHTYDYVRHFLTATMRLANMDSHLDEICFNDRFVKVRALPLGVDEQMIEVIQNKDFHQSEDYQSLKKSLNGRNIFLGIDRLDYTKGIPERLEAFQLFLQRNPEYVGKVVLIQICVPSREEVSTYGKLRATVERLVSKINGTYSQPGYSPIQYIYQSLSKDQILELYHLSDVALVTPLRDGLNLVCKEYVCARTKNSGALILSEFAGAASEMGEAILVNPKNIPSVAKAMLSALEMPLEEKERRMKAMRSRILSTTNHVWSTNFMKEWQDQANKNHNRSRTLIGSVADELMTSIKEKKRVFLFLDFDGTLTPIVRRPEDAIPTKELKQLLTKLQNETSCEVSIVTGRSKLFCEEHFCAVPINLVAEHGAYIRYKNDPQWYCQITKEEFAELKPKIMRILEHFTNCVPGSFIEEKHLSVVWHYRCAEPVFARSQSFDLSQDLLQLLSKTSYSVFSGKKNLDIRHCFSSKGRAVEALLKHAQLGKGDAILTAGDDRTDEEMHKVSPEENYSIHIGQANPYAKYYLKTSDDMIALLKALTMHCQRDKPQALKPEALSSRSQETQGASTGKQSL